ncbi:MAG: hypothetical protein NVS1B3_03380 [Candidatus Dormibacteraceae bacterium]
MLREFMATRGISFPLLSDQGSRVITELGLLDRELAAHHGAFNVPVQDHQWGVAYPAVFVLDAAGRVVQKRIQEHYRAREGAAKLLEEALGIATAPLAEPQRAAAPRVRIKAFADSESYVRWQKTRLHVELGVEPGWHMYGRPIPAEYTPLVVEVEPQSGLEVGEPELPPARPFKVEGLEEQFYVYEGNVRVTVPIAVNVPAEHGEITVRVTVRHQVCSDTECMPPSASTFSISLQEAPGA